MGWIPAAAVGETLILRHVPRWSARSSQHSRNLSNVHSSNYSGGSYASQMHTWVAHGSYCMRELMCISSFLNALAPCSAVSQEVFSTLKLTGIKHLSVYSGRLDEEGGHFCRFSRTKFKTLNLLYFLTINNRKTGVNVLALVNTF